MASLVTLGTLSPSGPEEPHSTPFHLLTACQPGQQGGCLFVVPQGFLLGPPGSSQLSGGWELAAHHSPPPVAASSCLLMTKPASRLFVSAVRDFQMGLYFGLLFSVDRERDGFNLMGFSQQLGSEQTGSEPGFTEFLPAPPPPSRDTWPAASQGWKCPLVRILLSSVARVS